MTDSAETDSSPHLSPATPIMVVRRARARRRRLAAQWASLAADLLDDAGSCVGTVLARAVLRLPETLLWANYLRVLRTREFLLLSAIPTRFAASFL